MRCLVLLYLTTTRLSPAKAHQLADAKLYEHVTGTATEEFVGAYANVIPGILQRFCCNEVTCLQSGSVAIKIQLMNSRHDRLVKILTAE
jgi:hypothetical protein